MKRWWIWAIAAGLILWVLSRVKGQLAPTGTTAHLAPAFPVPTTGTTPSNVSGSPTALGAPAILPPALPPVIQEAAPGAGYSTPDSGAVYV
jgi:hypothetical protein